MDRKKFADMLGIPEVLTSDGRHKLSRVEVSAAPYKRWNCFIDIISEDPKLIPVGPIRDASLVFLYESLVQQGGHDLYFSNTDSAYATENIQALQNFGDNCRAKVLSEAYTFQKTAPDVDYELYDERFHKCEPTLGELLEKHLEKNESLYIEWE